MHHILDEMCAQRPRINVSSIGLAWMTGSCGDPEGAFRWIDQAAIERDILFGSFHIDTPSFAPCMAVDPRYEALLARFQLTDVAR